MKTKNGKKWDSLNDGQKISYAEKLFEDSKKNLTKHHFKWYMNYMFIDGNHYSYYNSVTNTIEQKPRKKGEVRITINKIRSSIRAIKNWATRTRPKWVITPGDTDPDTIENARRVGKFLDYLYRHIHFELIIEGAVDSVLNTSIAWAEVDWDEDADDGMGQIRVDLHDPFDIYPDPGGTIYAGKFEGSYVIKAIKKSVEQIQNDERYDKSKRKKVKSDEELAASEMKSRLERKRMGKKKDDTDRATLKEIMFLESSDNEKDGRIHLFTYAGGQVLRDEPLKDRSYRIYPMQVPMDPLRLYHRPWTSDAIPLNKALDRTVSQKIMYVNQALVYRLIMEKGANPNVVTNEMGQFVEVNKNRDFQQMDMLPLPTALDSLTQEMTSFTEDILGVHDAALGRMPPGARSGRLLEALQAADSNNLAGITKSLETWLRVIGKAIIEIASEKYVASRVARITEPEEGQEYLRVIGENADQELENATLISDDDEVEVSIGSWLGHTREAQRETLLELGGLGILPAKEVLRQFEFPNVEELSEKAREERLEQHTMDSEIAGRQEQAAAGQPAQAGQPAPAGAESEMKILADEENTAMMNGEALPPTEGADISHTQTHIDFVRSGVFQQEAREDLVDIFQQHIEGELQNQGVR